MFDALAAEQLAQVVIRGLASGQTVEIDGLGVFRPDLAAGYRFEPRPPRVFIAYAREDMETAGALHAELTGADFSAWMDTKNLLAGQDWPRAIENAIETSDFFIACFSRNSAGKRGGFQAEIRYALDCARRIPLDDIFIVPLRLDECSVPRAIRRTMQYFDLFPDWRRGVRRLIAMLRREAARRLKRQVDSAAQ
jgi:hypothetical protein